MIDEATLARTAASTAETSVAADVPAAAAIPTATASAAIAAAETAVPLSSNPQEDQFLKSRLARFNDNQHHHHTTTRKNNKRDALHAFWTILRRKLRHWNERLVTIEETYQINTNKNNNNNNNNTTKSNKNNNKQDGLDALERLRLELEQWRKHCMSMSTTTSTTATAVSTIINDVDSGDNNKKEDRDDEWLVPDELSLMDLKLLHGEFTKCSDQWETVRDRLFPKGKFIFRRYREALARRNIRQDDFAALEQTTQKERLQRHSQLETRHNDYNHTKGVQSSSSTGTGGSAVLENLSHVSVVIDINGKVQATTTQPTTNATFQVDKCTNATTIVDDNNTTSSSGAWKAAKTSLPQISTSSLLIRSLQHCRVIL
jgi:hypothetical protein